MRTFEVETRVLPLRCTAVVGGKLRPDALASWLAGAYRAVNQYLLRVGVAMAGRPFARFTFLGDMIAIEAGFPVPYEVPGDGVVEPSTLPDGLAAVTSRWGTYDDLDRTDRVLRRWLDERGYQPAGPHWEVYYTDPHTVPHPAFWRTEVVMPYRTARVTTLDDIAVGGERAGRTMSGRP